MLKVDRECMQDLAQFPPVKVPLILGHHCLVVFTEGMFYSRLIVAASMHKLQVLRHTGGDVYARSPAEWRQRSATAAAVRSDFAAMLGDDAPAQPRGGGGGAGAGGAGSAEQDAVAASAAGAAQDGGGTKAKEAKRRAAAADDVATEQAGAGQPTPDKPKKARTFLILHLYSLLVLHWAITRRSHRARSAETCRVCEGGVQCA